VEGALRLAAYAAMGWAAWLLMAGAEPPAGTVRETGTTLAAEPRRWTARPPAETLAVELSRAPGPGLRARLAALRGAGTVVTWADHGVGALALEVLPVADPAGGLLAMVTAPTGYPIELSDSLGILDTARGAAGGASFALPARRGAIMARAGGEAATAHADSLAPRRLALFGRPDWETKFALAALEERGWEVDARIVIAPGISRTTGRPFPLDTARHAAAVVLERLDGDEAAAVARFVQRGGGLVLGPAAATGPLGTLAPALPGPPLRPAALTFDASRPRRFLGFAALSPRAGATVLEREGARATLAARRAGAGRVLVTAFDETWRWRLAGGDGAVDDHAAWWAALVAAAAYRATVPGAAAPATPDPAPGAALVAALGPAAERLAEGRKSGGREEWLPVAAIVIFGALLGEWGLRRR
jgi:hypothetical protein